MTAPRQCTACSEDLCQAKAARASCRHEYCSSCLESYFQSSLSEGGRFPPRCCGQPFDITAVGQHLTLETLRRYERERAEIETPNKVYCSRGRCSAFIPPSCIVNTRASCPSCGHKTCTSCKEPFHTGNCPANTDYERQMSAARRFGWQTCPRCGRLVELDSGCHHMICLCGVEFCYFCGRVWKTCRCNVPRDPRAEAYERIIERTGTIPPGSVEYIAPVFPGPEQRPRSARPHPSSHLWGQPFRSHLAVGSMISSHLRQQELRPGDVPLGVYQTEAYHLERIRQEVLEFRRQHENDWKFNDAFR